MPGRRTRRLPAANMVLAEQMLSRILGRENGSETLANAVTKYLRPQPIINEPCPVCQGNSPHWAGACGYCLALRCSVRGFNTGIVVTTEGRVFCNPTHAGAPLDIVLGLVGDHDDAA